MSELIKKEGERCETGKAFQAPSVQVIPGTHPPSLICCSAVVYPPLSHPRLPSVNTKAINKLHQKREGEPDTHNYTGKIRLEDVCVSERERTTKFVDPVPDDTR